MGVSCELTSSWSHDRVAPFKWGLEHIKTEFGKKNFEEKFGESETFYQNKFSPATGVMIRALSNAVWQTP